MNFNNIRGRTHLNKTFCLTLSENVAKFLISHSSILLFSLRLAASCQTSVLAGVVSNLLHCKTTLLFYNKLKKKGLYENKQELVL